MQLEKLQLKNFRCFDQININLSSPIVLIEGRNGSGKTTILEALSYLCYLRSFRTHITKELINEKFDNFFVKAEFIIKDTAHEIKVGFSGKKRLVKIDNKTVLSYKDLINHYRTITLIEDDLGLIKEGPEIRRTFIDQHIMLTNPQSLYIFRKYKKILVQRNALLFKGFYKEEDYILWTKSLWELSNIIQNMRIEALSNIERTLTQVNNIYFPELRVKLQYEPKNKDIKGDFENFIPVNKKLYESEQIQKRTLFGVHLDDFSILFLERKTRMFASRGQQKLLVLLIKIAQIKLLTCDLEGPIVFLLDDFMTDFDSKRLEELIPLLISLNIQLIFTCPIANSNLKQLLQGKNALIIQLEA